MKWLTLACLACLALLVTSALLRLRAGVEVAVPGAAATAVPVAAPRDDLDAVRRACDPAALDALVAARRQAVAIQPDDAQCLRACAEALLERIALCNQRLGLRVGEPLYSELPPPIAADVDAALDLLARARRAGDDSAANHRLEADLLCNRITGLGTALQWTSRIESALATAAERDDRDPQLHVSLGLRKLLAPTWLGHDPAGALQHFEYSAQALATDERPRVFAAMASWLLQRRQQAIAWLEQAVALNPANAFARAVLARVRRGEAEPFCRDLDAAEAGPR